MGAKVKDPQEAVEMFLPTYDPKRPRQTDEEMLLELAKIPGLAFKPKG